MLVVLLDPEADNDPERDSAEPWSDLTRKDTFLFTPFRVQELCENRGGHPGLPVLMTLTVSVDVKQY